MTFAEVSQRAGVGVHAASKAVLVRLTRQRALEWVRCGVPVNVLRPGDAETDLSRDFLATEAGQAQVRRIPQRRLGRPQEHDGPLLLPASDAGAFVSWTALVADGGHPVSPHRAARQARSRSPPCQGVAVRSAVVAAAAARCALAAGAGALAAAIATQPPPIAL